MVKYLCIDLRLHFKYIYACSFENEFSISLIINASLEEANLVEKLLNGFDIGIFYWLPETKY